MWLGCLYHLFMCFSFQFIWPTSCFGIPFTIHSQYTCSFMIHFSLPSKFTRVWLITMKLLGGGNSNIVFFLSRSLGKMHPFWLAHIFQMCWLNHQLEFSWQPTNPHQPAGFQAKSEIRSGPGLRGNVGVTWRDDMVFRLGAVRTSSQILPPNWWWL